MRKIILLLVLLPITIYSQEIQIQSSEDNFLLRESPNRNSNYVKMIKSVTYSKLNQQKEPVYEYTYCTLNKSHLSYNRLVYDQASYNGWIRVLYNNNYEIINCTGDFIFGHVNGEDVIGWIDSRYISDTIFSHVTSKILEPINNIFYSNSLVQLEGSTHDFKGRSLISPSNTYKSFYVQINGNLVSLNRDTSYPRPVYVGSYQDTKHNQETFIKITEFMYVDSSSVSDKVPLPLSDQLNKGLLIIEYNDITEVINVQYPYKISGVPSIYSFLRSKILSIPNPSPWESSGMCFIEDLLPFCSIMEYNEEQYFKYNEHYNNVCININGKVVMLETQDWNEGWDKDLMNIYSGYENKNNEQTFIKIQEYSWYQKPFSNFPGVGLLIVKYKNIIEILLIEYPGGC
jgi:hypothetical protein